jgi:alkylation response protein AidB-like acyl-CoA dehydrogenase
MPIMADDAAPSPAQVLARAEVLAADVFAPAAMAVEASQQIPPGHLDRLAAEGLYGLAGPREAGGLDLPPPMAGRVIETLAGACLSTTFVWLQQHSVVRAVARTGTPGLRDSLLGPLCRGERRAGIALGGTLPGPPRLRAQALPGGYRLDGSSPWVTGWGLIDTLYVAGRDAQRLAREALFLLVFGSRPTIKQALTGLLTGDGAHAEGAAWRNR